MHKGPKVEIVDSPIPTPGPEQIVTKVIVSGSNPKDWKVPEWMTTSAGEEAKLMQNQRPEYTNKSINQGDDIAGIVHAVGEKVTEFKPGDRIAAFHQMMAPGGSYAEYAVSWEHCTFHLPKQTSFEGKRHRAGPIQADR